MRNWYIEECPGTNTILDCFDYNEIKHNKISLWDNNVDFGRYDISSDIMSDTAAALVLHHNTLRELITWAQSKIKLIEFLQSRSIWVWSDLDGFLGLCTDQKIITDLDLLLPPGQLTLMIDSQPTLHHWSQHLKNIQLKIFPNSTLIKMPRIWNASVEKTFATKDFLMVTHKKRSRPHRQHLIKELQSRPGLIECGQVAYRSTNARWVGHQPNQHIIDPTGNKMPIWGHASMDLYLNCWTEIVPETLYKDGYYFTEKTVKPISTKTPFLAVSNKGYLQYLKSKGFYTFSSLISEKYDDQHRIQDRVRLLVDQVQDISRNGAKSFYTACNSILEHNHQRLAEITGSWTYSMDTFIFKELNLLDR